MNEREGIIAMKGNPLTLVGREIKAGDKAPDFEVVANDLARVNLASFKGKTLIILSVPSLDTDVCDREARRFNEEAARIGSDIQILTVSMDLPFAQKRWCGAAGVERIKVLSDYQKASFGENYGVLIKNLRLLARAVFIIDKAGVVRYVQLVKELTNEPDYEAVLRAAKDVR